MKNMSHLFLYFASGKVFINKGEIDCGWVLFGGFIVVLVWLCKLWGFKDIYIQVLESGGIIDTMLHLCYDIKIA